MKPELKDNINQILKDVQSVEGVEVVSIYADEVEVNFKEGHNRTGGELLQLQKVLFNYKIFNFIKSEKVDYWNNTLKQIKFYIH